MNQNIQDKTIRLLSRKRPVKCLAGVVMLYFLMQLLTNYDQNDNTNTSSSGGGGGSSDNAMSGTFENEQPQPSLANSVVADTAAAPENEAREGNLRSQWDAADRVGVEDGTVGVEEPQVENGVSSDGLVEQNSYQSDAALAPEQIMAYQSDAAQLSEQISYQSGVVPEQISYESDVVAEETSHQTGAVPEQNSYQTDAVPEQIPATASLVQLEKEPDQIPATGEMAEASESEPAAVSESSPAPPSTSSFIAREIASGTVQTIESDPSDIGYLHCGPYYGRLEPSDERYIARQEILLLHGARFAKDEWQNSGLLDQICEKGGEYAKLSVTAIDLKSHADAASLGAAIAGLSAEGIVTGRPLVVVTPTASGKAVVSAAQADIAEGVASASDEGSLLGKLLQAWVPIGIGWMNIISDDVFERFDQIPVLSIHGSRDNPGRLLSHRLEQLAKATVFQLEGDNQCFFDSPDLFVDKLISFINQVVQPGG